MLILSFSLLQKKSNNNHICSRAVVGKSTTHVRLKEKLHFVRKNVAFNANASTNTIQIPYNELNFLLVFYSNKNVGWFAYVETKVLHAYFWH